MDHHSLGTNKNLTLYFLVFLIFCNNLMWMFSLPYNSAPDEGDHYLVCNFIRKEGRLPIFTKDLKTYWMNHFTKLPVTREEVYFYSHSPKNLVPTYLYHIRFFPEVIDPYFSYILSAFFMKIASLFSANTFIYLFAARFVSAICGTLTALFTFKIAQKIFPKEPNLGVLSAVFVGFLPQFTFVSAYLNQDAFTALITTLVIYFVFQCLKGWNLKYVILLGFFLGLTVLSKINSYPVILLAIFSLLIFGEQKKDKKFKIISITLLCILVTSGWFFLRNYFIYGYFWPRHFIDNYMKEFYQRSPLAVTDFAKLKPLDLSNIHEVKRFLWLSFKSFWGLFGWMEVYMPGFFYSITKWLTLAAFIGFFKKISEELLDNSKEKKTFLMMLCLPFIILIMTVIHSSQNEFNPQGRYFFPAVSLIAISFSLGWLGFFKQAIYKQNIFISLVTLLVGLNILAFIFSVIKVYYV